MQTLALNEPEREVGRIVIRLSNSLQLFHTLDPAPFREKELAIEAERYIVDQAEDLPKAVPIEIVIHLAEADSSEAIAPDLAPAVAQHFLMRAHEKARELRALFKSGRRSLIVGVVILSSCFAAGWLAGLILGDGPLPNIVRESFLILGWVAIWKPSEIFLYGWPTIVEERRLFERLSAAAVVLTAVPERQQ
ncbi:hypothetical protein [Bradyrhizobium sp. LB11.1]|uniref:hypothetical protein n=1 Tax=Bradyrhizobium sp. LB11.1 TaxID=3156326 RepID=UPI00339B415F